MLILSLVSLAAVLPADVGSIGFGPARSRSTGLRQEMRRFTAGELNIDVSEASGRFSLRWKDGTELNQVEGSATLPDGIILETSKAKGHTVRLARRRSSLGDDQEISISHEFSGGRELRHRIRLLPKTSEAIVSLEVLGTRGTNSIVPMKTSTPVQIPHGNADGKNPLRALFVPWDNDMYFRYRSDGWGEGEGDGDGSYEVGAVWDDQTRNALLIGSIDHDLWQSAIRFRRGPEGSTRDTVVGVSATSGVTSKYTHDVVPHGTVTGKRVSSSGFLVGRYWDWRDGLERFGEMNARVRPALAWAGAKPFFWNSWSGHKMEINAAVANGAREFVQKELPTFRSGGTAYINFDAGAGKLSSGEMADFLKRTHAAGLRAGIYWTPFACWGKLEDVSPFAGVPYAQLVLRDRTGEPLPKLDGAYPLDPSHPLVLKQIDGQLAKFVAQGFDYIKLDFLSHGALEGKHADPRVQTGTAAYNMGMKRIADDLSPKRIGRPFFISLSIAPLFPHGYAHSRRISCDVFANIGASEYLLNSANYAWWEAGRLYRYSDPDSATVYQAAGEDSTTEAEARTRFVASIVGGGMMILGDDLRKPEAVRRIKALFGNDEALRIAREDSPFRPVDGDTDYAAGDLFVRSSGDKTYIALFNFDKAQIRHHDVALARLGLSEAHYRVRDILTGAQMLADGTLKVDLPAMDCALLELSRG